MSYDVWKYFPGTTEPPSGWTDLNFDDSGWFSGKGGIGYGDGDDSTVISPMTSVYMRIKFQVTNKDIISYGVLHVDFDDGFVAYLNGHEIARENIGVPGTRPSHDEFATLSTYEAQMPSGGLPAQFVINDGTIRDLLNQGENVLALQVHNCSATSSDLSSTTFFSVGIETAGTYYRPVPAWFKNPLNDFSRLPVVSIDTKGQQIPDEPKIIVRIKVIDNGLSKMNFWYDPGTDYEGPAAIEIRGQSSQMFPKKSYAFEIRGVSGQDSSASLLGMPKEEDWILHAHYSDKTMIRNALTFYLGSSMELSWQPRFRYCTVYLNGQYQGIYLLMENIKRGKNRVDISKLKHDDISEIDITGGYILKVDKTGGLSSSEYFVSYPAITYPNSRNYNFTYVYPKPDSLVARQREYIRKYITDFENALNGNDFKTSESGYRKYIDVPSFIDFQIIQELTNNVDGYRFSTYFYKKKITEGGLLYAGPLWDFDLCYGNVNYSDINLSTSGWLYPNYGPTEGYPMHWWARLMGDQDYARRFVVRWNYLRNKSFTNNNIMHFIDSITSYLGDEVDRNYQRWPILGKYVWPNYFVGTTYQQEIDYLKNWINARLESMDLATSVSPDFFDITFDKEIDAFPNPVTDKLTVVFAVRSAMPVTMELFDVTGRKFIKEMILPDKTGLQITEKDLSMLKTGIYILMLRQNERMIGKKMIIKN